MGTITINKNKRNPNHQSSSSLYKSNHISKKPKKSLLISSSRKSLVSRLHLYPDHITPITRQIRAPCSIITGFNTTQKRFTQNLWKKLDRLVSEYLYAKESAIGSCRYVEFEKVVEFGEKDDDTGDVEVIEVDNGTNEKTVDDDIEEKDDGMGEVEVIEVENEKMVKGAEGGDGLVEVEEIRAKYEELDQKDANGKKMEKLALEGGLDGMEVDVDVDVGLRKESLKKSVERSDFSLRRLRFQIKLQESKRKSCQLSRSVKKEEDVAKNDPFRPLTEEEVEMVDNALSYSNRKKVLVTHENSNISISGEALQCLRPHAWLNDEVINIYLELLKDRERREPKTFLKCHFFNTFFYKKLMSGRTGYDYKSVRRWTTQKKLGYGLLECDKIFVPIHKEIHWCLAVINKKEQKFLYIDSLGGADKKVLRELAKYITDEVKDKTGENIDVTSWEHEFVTDLPNQENGYDCGMFMIKYTDFYSRDIGLRFNQENMTYFRLRTANEILRLRAD